jgi:hypothetical protein
MRSQNSVRIKSLKWRVQFNSRINIFQVLIKYIFNTPNDNDAVKMKVLSMSGIRVNDVLPCHAQSLKNIFI